MAAFHWVRPPLATQGAFHSEFDFINAPLTDALA